MISGTDKQLRLGVIFGGRSGEHEVSLMSARSMLNVLDPQRYQVTQIGITLDGRWLTGANTLAAFEAHQYEGLHSTTILADPSFPGIYILQIDARKRLMELFTPLDVVFPMLHGTFGEDGTLQGLLEMAEVAYVGAGVVGSAVGMDKGVYQSVMLANHIPVVETMVVLRRELQDGMEAVLDAAEKMAVKSTDMARTPG